jgi:chromosome segregation ATPase
MTIDERTRLELRQWFTANMTEELADAMMELMPAVGYTQLATKADIADSQLLLRTEMAELRAELKTDMAELRSKFADLKGEFAGLRSEFGELKGEFGGLRGEFRELRAETARMGADLNANIDRKFASQLRWLVGVQFGAMGFIGALVTLA